MKKFLAIGIILLFLFCNISFTTLSDEYGDDKIGTVDNDIDWWPMFQHDSKNTGFSTSKGPETNHIKWTYNFNDTFDFSPIVASDFVYVTLGNQLYCLDANNGQLMWNISIIDDYKFTDIPVYHEEKIYATYNEQDHDRGGGLFCFDTQSMNILWRYQTLKNKYGYDYEYCVGPPKYESGYIYFGTWGGLGIVHCVDAITGTYRWLTCFGLGGVTTIGIPVTNARVYCSTSWAEYGVHCLAKENGDYIWQWDAPCSCSVPTGISVKGEKIFLGFDHIFICLDAVKGDELWNITGDRCSWWGGTPCLNNEHLFTFNSGLLYCLNQSNGDIVWHSNIDEWISRDNSNMAITHGSIYLVSYYGTVYCLDVETGAITWTYKTYKKSVSTSPAIANGKVYVGIKGVLYCFGLPSANFSCLNEYPSTNDKIVFDASDSHCSESDEIISYEWDFDNNGIYDDAVGKKVEWSFSSGGNYSIGLKITTSEGDNDIYIGNIYIDDTKPSIKITKPINGIYFNNSKKFDFFTPVIFGPIQIEFEASDIGYGLDHIEIFISDEKKWNFTEESFVYIWDEPLFGKYAVKVIAYDNSNNKAEDNLEVWKFF
ncbi:MAG: PQQ-binding-like beta-propeller repeat protein [Candidatus Thermoplasmatota archaeon]|nr:PQQ-binding-like beta-propeller repeat protein [Candidatus Thermoplasmatota archaeon]